MTYTEKQSDCVAAVGGETIRAETIDVAPVITEPVDVTPVITAIKHHLAGLAKPFKVRGSPDADYIHAMQDMVQFVAEMPVSLRRSAAGMAMCYSMYYDGSMVLDRCRARMADLEQDMRAAVQEIYKSRDHYDRDEWYKFSHWIGFLVYFD